MEGYILLVISVIGCALSACMLGYSLFIARLRQKQAYAGDPVAAKHIVLPCYKPILEGMITFYSLFASVLLLTFADSNSEAVHVLQYFGFALMVIFSITPVLLIQSSVSIKSFWNIALTIFPWWLVCTVFWVVAINVESLYYVFMSLFVICSCVPTAIVSLGILTKRIKSRVQLGSRSNRNAAEFLLVYSVFYAVFVVLYMSSDHSGDISLIFAVIIFLFNQIFPWLNHRTLLADTKFWRGLGRHNEGLTVDEKLRESGVDVHRPTMELNFVTSSLQSLLSEIRPISLDFAYLQLVTYLGQGASAKVYEGKYSGHLGVGVHGGGKSSSGIRKVAVKVSTPPEVTEEILSSFLAEAKLASSLRHKNIVSFFGICIRPPQISMVFEFCQGGNLQSSLRSQPGFWTAERKLKACLDMCHAVAYLHSRRTMHRDIKCENFFVCHENDNKEDIVIKLGDFGEACDFPSSASERLDILGTVAYMAPELIRGEKNYTHAVDTYALAMSLFEAWLGGVDAYPAQMSTFEIYEKVTKGDRPSFPQDMPPALQQVILLAWAPDAHMRPPVKDLGDILKEAMGELGGGAETGDEDGGEGEDGGTHRFSLGSLLRRSVNYRKKTLEDLDSKAVENAENGWSQRSEGGVELSTLSSLPGTAADDRRGDAVHRNAKADPRPATGEGGGASVSPLHESSSPV